MLVSFGSFVFGGLAQLGERQDRNLKVRGSNPLPSTTFRRSSMPIVPYL